jgi:DNA-binding response OmpR family regulator
LSTAGFGCSLAPYGDEVLEQLSAKVPEVIFIEINGQPFDSLIELCRDMKRIKELPIIALVRRESLHKLEGHSEINDFVLAPYAPEEAVFRVKRILGGTGIEGKGVLHYGDLAIDYGQV